MKKTAPFARTLSSALCAALILACPGAGCWPALAAELGAPAGESVRLPALAAPQSLPELGRPLMPVQTPGLAVPLAAPVQEPAPALHTPAAEAQALRQLGANLAPQLQGAQQEGDPKSAGDQIERRLEGAGGPSGEGPYYGAPTGPTQPYRLGKTMALGHKVVSWALRKFKLTGETGWLTLPPSIGVIGALNQVHDMRTQNEFGTRHLTQDPAPAPWKSEYSTQRAPDGSWTDLKDANVGRAGMPRGYNVDPKYVQPRPVDPKLIQLGVDLFTRHQFIPAPVNQHFGSWIQAQVEGWFGTDLPATTKPIQLQLPRGYAWHEGTMSIRPTPEAPNKKPGVKGPPVIINVESPDWALRQIYGKSAADQAKIRSFADGKLKIEEGQDGLLPGDPAYDGKIQAVGQPRNTWIGRGALDILFVRHHNWVADQLARYYRQGPDFTQMKWGLFSRVMWRLLDRRKWLAEKKMFEAMDAKQKDEWLFNMAWNVNSAVNAKIHTVDWTEILFYGNPVLMKAMEVDYYGFLGKGLKKLWFDKPWAHALLGRFVNNDLFSGMAGSNVQRWSSYYELGNSFIDAYRIRELVRDMLRFYSLGAEKPLGDKGMAQMQGASTLPAMREQSLADLNYTLGLNLAGDLVLNNVPNFMAHLAAMHGETVDMRMRDLMRQDERGSPRYNDAMRALRLPPAKDFLDLTKGDVELAERLSKSYDGDIEAVHLHVGQRAAPRPHGIVISLWSFIIFSLNAPARFAANRFLSELFVPGVYTPWGVNHVLNTDFKSVLLTHYPDLAPALDGVSSGFLPWNRLHPQTDPKVEAEEKALGIAVHTRERLEAMGPLAQETLFKNSAAGAVPDVSNVVLPKGMSAPAGVNAEASLLDGKPTLVLVYKGLGGLFRRDEIRQVGPTLYVGRSYTRWPFGQFRYRRSFVLDASKDGPSTESLVNAVEANAAVVGKADAQNALIGLAAATLAWLAGVHILPILALALIPAAASVWSWSLRRPALNAWRNVVRLSDKGAASRAGQFGAFYASDAALHQSAVVSLLGSLAVTGAGFALGMTLAHPLAGLILGLGLISSVLVPQRAGDLRQALIQLKPRLYGLLMKDQPRRDPAGLHGTSAIEKRYGFFSEDGMPGVITPRTSYDGLRKLGESRWGSLSTALLAHLMFSGKSQRSMTAAEKVRYEMGRFDIYAPNIIAAAEKSGTGVYARKDAPGVKRGDVDMAVFNGLLPAGQDYVTRADMDRYFESRIAPNLSWFKRKIGRIAFNHRFDQLFDLFADRLVYQNGQAVPAVSRAQLLDFFQGGLQYDQAARRQ